MSLYNFERSVFITPDDKRDLPNVCSEKNNTNRSSVLLLRLVLFFSERTLIPLYFFSFNPKYLLNFSIGILLE